MRLQMSWANGDVILNLAVSPEDWSKIVLGERVVVKGRGYPSGSAGKVQQYRHADHRLIV
jgi:hypothetical protein